jgi:hypothetical protein
MDYRQGKIYATLERIIQDAGITVRYCNIPNDSIWGACLARSSDQDECIEMPDNGDAFQDEISACLVLGHEMGHLLTGQGNSDEPDKRYIIEGTCDCIGAWLYRLADMTAATAAERDFLRRAGKLD